jgi:hypothetical protein
MMVIHLDLLAPYQGEALRRDRRHGWRRNNRKKQKDRANCRKVRHDKQRPQKRRNGNIPEGY